MIRTILVTKVKNKETEEIQEVYGRYDAVALERKGFIPVDSFRRQYTMSDETFAKYGEVVNNEE